MSSMCLPSYQVMSTLALVMSTVYSTDAKLYVNLTLSEKKQIIYGEAAYYTATVSTVRRVPEHR